MTDNEIIKALECCGRENCNGCPYRNGKCHQGNPMIRDALALINRQEAENERLLKFEKIAGATIERQEAEKEALIAGQETLQKYIAEQKAEIERLRKENTAWMNDNNVKAANIEYLSKIVTATDKMIITARAEAIKEFAKYLIDRAEQSEISVGDIPDLVVDFQNRTQEDASIGSQPEWKQAMLRTFLGRGL